MIGLIAAIDLSGLLAYQDRIPWYKPEDLKRFKQVTIDSIIVMGRKTYESIGKPLPKRVNCVVTRNATKLKSVAPGLEIYDDLNTTLANLKDSEKPVWVIGGAEIYKQALQSDLVDQIDLTIINGYWVPENEPLDHNKCLYFPSIPWKYSQTNEIINSNDNTLLHRTYQKSKW